MEEKQKTEQQQTKKSDKEKASAPQKSEKLFVIRVRGRIRLRKEVQDTLTMLHLYKTNYGTLVENTPTMLGMIEKVKDYITWGEVDEVCVQEIFAKRGTIYQGPLTDAKKKIIYKGRWIEHNGKKYNKYFKLNPPQQGYGREGIKKTFARKGALGNRGEKINNLVKRML